LFDWCYENPKWSDGKELCDLLVVFDDVAVIWQIKDLKKGRVGKYNQREVEKNLRQLNGAKRRLFELNDSIELENPRRGKELFNPTSIKEAYLISALVGEGEDYFEFVKKNKDKTIHVFDKEAVETILNELDTIKDFIQYLKEKEDFLSADNQITLLGGEKELLAYYLMNERNFKRLGKYDGILIDEGCWEDLQKKPEYLAKKEENKISYGWDSIINRAHTCGGEYELIARELAKADRFQRRVLSKNFFEAHIRADSKKKENFYQRIIKVDGITYCFVFANAPSREHRKNLLSNVCFVARDFYKENKKVIGIATEMKILPECSYDFCLLDFPEWTNSEEEEAKRIKKELKIFKNLEYGRFQEDEYPVRT